MNLRKISPFLNFLDRLHRGQPEGATWWRYIQCDGFSYMDGKKKKSALRSHFKPAAAPPAQPTPISLINRLIINHM